MMYNRITRYGFCATCHGSADGQWVNVMEEGHGPIPMDQQMALMRANAVSAQWSPVAQAAAELGASMIPGVGEAMDIEALTDPNATTGVMIVAGISLALSVLTLGLTPNFGRAAATGIRYSDEYIGAAEAAAHLERMNPSDLRFTQATASPNFSSGPSETITDMVQGFRANPNAAESVTLDVVEYQGKLYSLNNRRLVALQAAEVQGVAVRRLNLADEAVRRRFEKQVRDGLIEDGRKIIIESGRKAQAEARRWAAKYGVLKYLPPE